MIFLRLARLRAVAQRHGGSLQRSRPFSVTTFQNTDQSRSTLSGIWIPSGGVAPTRDESGYEKLIRGGFLRQSHTGIFQLLPLGLRVQQKIESLLDKHMRTLGASRVSLSTITSEELWRRSNRLDKVGQELFRFTDRKDVGLMLSPTHEEEITSLVANLVKSYKELPLRLFQITPKYRDEIRPRHGLLRSREFLMKDLYTFDVSFESALETYKDVSRAYQAFFAELKLPVIAAEASSGAMGGDQSHEYHLAHPIGADSLVTCSSCGYAANDEVATSRLAPLDDAKSTELYVWRGISKDRKTLFNAWYPQSDGFAPGEGLNINALKAAFPELDASIKNALPLWKHTLKANEENHSQLRLVNVVDSRMKETFEDRRGELSVIPSDLEAAASLKRDTLTKTSKGTEFNLLPMKDGDGCPRCESGTLQIQRALELGHTFHLGTRYSEPLEACVTLPENPKERVPMQMGCHGIGISRILGSIAEHQSDEKGLRWPRAVAPFEVAIIPSSGATPETLAFYDKLASRDALGQKLDVVLDDRKDSFGWKMRDADMTGYPVVVVLGRTWRDSGICEVQCRSLGVKENVAAEDVDTYVRGLLAKL